MVDLGLALQVHVITEKGRGHAPAINDEAEKFHAVPRAPWSTGLSTARAFETARGCSGQVVVEGHGHQLFLIRCVSSVTWS